MTPQLEQTIRNDFNFVRNDIADLKKCQLQYFILSITGTAALFGINNYFRSEQGINYIIPLIPLLIILPCWWIFFDKAHTISRNTGYIQILEEILTDSNNASYYYYGFENALRILRFENNETIAIGKIPINVPNGYIPFGWKPALSLFSFKAHRFRYWLLNWFVFTALSVICCLFSSVVFLKSNPFASEIFLPTVTIIILFLNWCFVIITMRNTLKIVHKLIFGYFSYSSYYKIWQIILKFPVPVPGIILPNSYNRVKP